MADRSALLSGLLTIEPAQGEPDHKTDGRRDRGVAIDHLSEYLGFLGQRGGVVAQGEGNREGEHADRSDEHGGEKTSTAIQQTIGKALLRIAAPRPRGFNQCGIKKRILVSPKKPQTSVTPATLGKVAR